MAKWHRFSIEKAGSERGKTTLPFVFSRLKKRAADARHAIGAGDGEGASKAQGATTTDGRLPSEPREPLYEETLTMYMISRTNVGVGNLRRVYLHFGNFHRARVHAGMLRPRRRRARSLVTSTAIVRLAR